MGHRRAVAARLIALIGLGICAVVAVQAPHDHLTDPLTFALVACALCAAVAYVDFEDSIFIDASIVPLLLAAIFVGPLATFAVVTAAEVGAWARQRYRVSAALINTLATGAPSVIAALIFERVGTRTGTGFYVAIAAVSAGALMLNFAILVSLIALLYGDAVSNSLRANAGMLPAIAIPIAVAVAAVDAVPQRGSRSHRIRCSGGPDIRLRN